MMRLILFLAAALAALPAFAQDRLPGWMNGYWQTRSEDRALGLVQGVVHVQTGSGVSRADLWLPGASPGDMTGPFEASAIRRFQRDGRDWVAVDFRAGAATPDPAAAAPDTAHRVRPVRSSCRSSRATT